MADIGIKIRASDETKSAFDSVSRSLGTIQTSAASVAGALASIGVGVSVAGFVAMTKAIVDGLDAMNDLKDATGASIENISALEDVALRTGASFDTVSTALIKLNQGLNSAKPGSDTEAAINAIGLSVKDLKELDPAEAFRQIAVGLSGFADDANKARITQELFGKSLKEVAPLLKDLAENGQLNGTVTTAQAEAAEKLNKQIASLQKNALDLGRAFTSTLIPALADGVERFILANKHAGGLLNTLAMYLRLDYGKNVQGNLGEVEKQIAQLEQRATRITSTGAMAGNDKMIADLKAQAAYLKELRQVQILAEQGDNGDAISRRYMTPKQSIGNLPDKSAAKEAAAAAKKAREELEKELAEQAKLIAESAGLSGSFTRDWDNLSKIFEKGGYNLDQLTAAQAKLLAGQPGIKAAHDAETKAAEATEKANRAALDARQKYNDYLNQGLASVQAENQTIQDQIDRLGLNKEAIADLDAQRLESQAITQDLIVLKKIEQGVDEDQYEIYVKTAAELRKQAAIKRSLAGKETAIELGKETAKATFDEWKRGWEETDRLARDVFASWATDGSNAAQKIGDTLKKALLSAIYEATLKPIAFQLYTSIAGGGGAAGAVQAASGAGNALSGGSSLLSGLSSVTGAFGSSLSANFGATMNSFGSTIGLSIEGGLASIAEGTAASVASGLGSIAGALGPVAIGIGALSALKSAMDYTVKDLGSAIVANLGGGVTNVANRQDFQQTGGLFGGGTTQNSEWSAASADLTAYIDSQVKLVTESARAYGTALGLPVADLDSFKQQIEVSLTGLNADQAKEAINKAIGGFGDALVSTSFGSALADLKRDGENTGAALARLGNDLNGVNAVFAGVQHSLLSVDLAGAATASSLVSAAGGLANFQAQVTAMYGQLDAARQAFADANRNAYELQEQAVADASGFGSDSGSGGGGGGGTDALKEAIDYLAGASLTIRQWLDRLNSTDAGGLSADAQRTSAWASLQSQLVLARGGDRDALSGITGYADSYIDTINKTSKTEAEARLAIGKVRGQLAALPGQVSPEQFIVDAINANGGGAGAVATAVKSLGSKLTAELTVSARSEIVKMIEFVVDTDKLPNDLKQLALASADTMTKTVSFITGSKLSEENKQIALGTESLLTKTISYALGQDIPDEYKKLALKTSDSISKTISYIAKNLLDPKQAEIALMADNSIVKTIEMASKFLDADALKVAYAQSEVIRKMLEVSGGVLTPEQAMLLDNIAQYNKTISLFVSMDSTALDSAKDYIKRTLGTLDIEAVITGIPTTDDTGGVIPGQDVHKLLGGYINDLAKDGLIDGTDVGMIVGIVRRFGGTMADIAKATGWSLQQVIDFGAAWGIPEFAVGTDYIPRDMLAVVHKGEQIVPAAYNPHANGTAPGGANQAALVEEIRALRTDNQAQALALVQLQKRMNKLLERWDGNGMPETRVVTA